MHEGRKVLAVIPARAGSKRCPGKNKRPFRGTPLWKLAEQQAFAAGIFDRVVLSTDDGEILMEAVNPFLRMPSLATDTATNEDVCREVLAYHPDMQWVVLLQPTSPLRTVKDIIRCLEVAIDSGFDAACSYDTEGMKNGAVYACSAQWLLDGKDFTKWYADPYLMPMERSLDIDYPEQFE